MKRFLLILLVPALMLSSLTLLLQPQPVLAASTQSIKNQGYGECNNDLSGGSDAQNHPFCIDGYLAGYNGQPTPANCKNGGGSDGLGHSACEVGYLQGVQDRNKGSSTNGSTPEPANINSGLKTQAADYCINDATFGGGEINNCAAGYEWGFIGTAQQPSVCDNACATGYAKGYSIYQALPAYCQGWAVTTAYPLLDTQACQKGSAAKTSGNKDPCGSYNDSRKQKTACEQGYTTATTTSSPASSGSNAPTCEASGVTLSWLFCPIINSLASATDGIYSNIVQPLLKTAPINLANPSSDPTHTYAIWLNFRIYGNIFLIIALLVVVFGESIGGGLIDAYAAKKILPRLLIAAILINLSIYLVAFAVDITNIVGNGIGALIEAPFKNAGAFKLHINGSTGDLGVAALVGGGIWAAVSLGPLLEFLFLFFLIPAFLTMVAILATVLLRRGLIIFLILVAPVAFALYCLPNTEKYFRQWWNLLLRTLLVYPLIAVVFAIANVLSVTIDTTSGGVTKTFADFLSIVALFVPLFLIPYSFRISGGLIGRFHELAGQGRKQAHEAIKGNANDPTSWRNMTRRKLSNRVMSQREGVVNAGISMQKNRRSALGRTIGGSMATVAGLGNYQLKRSLKNKEASEIVQSQVSTGDDSSVRALFARKMNYRDENDNNKIKSGYFGTSARIGDDGLVIGQNTPQYSEFEVRKARSQAANDSSFHQAALTYEIGKAGDDYELGQIRQANAGIVSESPWLRAAGGGTWKGAGFSHQQTRRELKHESFNPDQGTYSRNSRAFTREVSENVGSWALSNMRTSTVKALQDDYANAQAYLTLSNPNSTPEQIQHAGEVQAELASNRDVSIAPLNNPQEAQEVIRSVQATANSLDARRQMGGSFALQGEGDEQTPVSGAQTGAPGKVSEEIQRLINQAATPPPATGRPRMPAAPPPPSGGPGTPRFNPPAGSSSTGGF